MSNGTVATYSFLPWVRQGVASKIVNQENLAGAQQTGPTERASITVSVHLQAGGSSAGVVDREVKLAGPGDVIGVSPDSILRVEPQAGTLNFEENYLPYIEFYEEDFPWRYTPASPHNSDTRKLRPWLYLLVIEDEVEYELDAGRFNEPLPYFKLLNTSALPTDGRDAWAFAHVHVNENLAENGTCVEDFKAAVDANPDVAHSRILSPRNLKENTNYTAFLIPAYETGRLAGLGRPTTGVDAWLTSWDSGSNTDNLFPYYHKWSFATGSEGDFESLVKKLKPRELDPEVGMRRLDIQEAADQLNANINEEFVGIGGALKTEWTANYPFTSNDFETKLVDLINLPEDMASGAVTGQDPVITPPLYGRWHSMEKTVPASGWVKQLNSEPGNRAAAGLGAMVVRQHQEEFMEYAWEQVGEILEANRRIGFTELSNKVGRSLHKRHLESQPNARLLQMTASMHSKVMDTTGTGAASVHESIRYSQLTRSGVSPALHRMMRPTGKIRKHFSEADHTLVDSANDGNVALTLPKTTYSSDDGVGVFHSDASVATLASEPPSYFGSNVEVNPFSALQAHHQSYPTVSVLSTPTDVVAHRGAVVATTDPMNSVVQPFAELIDVPSGMLGPSPTQLRPVMAHPIFPLPAYPYLEDISEDYIIPNISKVPDDTICLMIPNLEFIESFLVGMNHEMSRELLWREFPTDQRGTYFRQFWDKSDNPELAQTGGFIPDAVNDIHPISDWNVGSQLGSHDVVQVGQNVPTGDANVFLLIRGELLRKYPDTLIYAQKAVWQLDTDGNEDLDAPRVLDNSGAQGSVMFPQFKATIANDIHFFAFDLSANQARGSQNVNDPGWFFVMRERAGKVRFGLDIATGYLTGSGNQVTDWSDLTWGHLDGPTNFIDMENISLAAPNANVNNSSAVWGKSSADMANILYQEPVLVAYHGSDLLNF